MTSVPYQNATWRHRNMEVVIAENPADAGSIAATPIVALYGENPRAVLGLATGSTPTTLYDALAQQVETNALTLAEASAYLLDDYVGLAEHHPQRYRNVIDRDFTSKVDIAPTRVYGPDGLADDLVAECAAYEQSIADSGDIDLQCIGVGGSGNIGFNESGVSLESRTHIETHTAQTRSDNARFFDDDIDAVPVYGLTQGVATIMDAQHVVVMASGEHKAEAVRHIVEGPVTTMCPGSVLQQHPHATLVLDRAAASHLRRVPGEGEATG